MLNKSLIIISLVCCLCSSSCGVVFNTLSGERKNGNEYVHPYYISCDAQDKIMEYIQSNNIDGICNLFSEAVPVSPDEVWEVFNTIQGKIVATEARSIVGGVAKSDEGRYTLYTYTANIMVYTDSDNEYKVTISGSAVNVEHPEEVGIERFTVVDCKTGEYSNAGRWFTDNKR